MPPKKSTPNSNEGNERLVQQRQADAARKMRSRQSQTPETAQAEAVRKRIARKSQTPEAAEENRRKDAERKRLKRVADKEKNSCVSTPNSKRSRSQGSSMVPTSLFPLPVPECVSKDILIPVELPRAGTSQEEPGLSNYEVEVFAEISHELRNPARLPAGLQSTNLYSQEREAPVRIESEKQQNNSADIQRKARTYRLALKPIASDNQVPTLHIGAMNVICQFCEAVHFKGEKPSDGKFSLCCNKGRVELPPPGETDELIRGLITNCHSKSEHFMKNILRFNNAFAFASIGYKRPHPLAGRGPWTLRIQGQIHHNISAVSPDPSSIHHSPKYSQLYFLDPTEALQLRQNHSANQDLDEGLLKQLDVIMRRVNPYAGAYKTLREAEEEERRLAIAEGRPLLCVGLTIHTDRREDQRRYNLPSSNDIACVFKNADGVPPADRSVVARLHIPRQGKHFIRISAVHPMCDPMTYPIMFSRGDQGWHDKIWQVSKKQSTREERIREREERADIQGEAFELGESSEDCEDGETSRRRVTHSQFYCYKLAVRPNTFNPIHYCSKLTQWYITDGYTKLEGNRLGWIAKSQDKLQAGSYKVVHDYLATMAERANSAVGSVVILPSSFVGSPRAMQQAYQDAMAIVGKFGKPHLFITMTCNPRWPEIIDNIGTYQEPSDRPDIVARVFFQKFKELSNDIIKGQKFGVVVAMIHVIEFQKRGLPHAHILVILREEDAPKTAEDIDLMISAEIPDKTRFPKLFEIVMRSMIHGPCGSVNKSSPCMENGICTKDFPKPFINETNIETGGYPLYRRRQTGETYFVGEREVDNRWVVPYSPYLALKYNCHINVEGVGSMSVVKYLFKYVYKGHDCANIRLHTGISSATGREAISWNEVQAYLDTRYVTAPEACWRIFRFPLMGRNQAIYRLEFHLEWHQSVVFRPGEEEAALQNAEERDTELTGWFKLNSTTPSAKKFLYREIPEHFSWNKKARKWKPRTRRANVIGRIYATSPRDEELFSLRLLLLSVPGATSFEYLRTVDGIDRGTFKAAAIARNLLADDAAWIKTMKEAATFKMPSELRHLFVIICVSGSPQNPAKLFEDNITHLSEDFLHKKFTVDVSRNLALREIEQLLRSHGKELSNYGLPSCDMALIEKFISRFQNSYLMDDGGQNSLRGSHSLSADLMIARLNPLQKFAFESVMKAVRFPHIAQRQFFLDGPGGTGKTFVYNTIISHMLGRGETVLTVASTGIASTLLTNGRTYHSQFKLFPPITEATSSRIEFSSLEADILKSAKLVIWDEATMTPSHALNAVDTLFKRLLNREDLPFGGMAILMGGDFRQCLPIVPHGRRAAIVQTTIKSSPLWKKFTKLRLEQNMRTSTESQIYADWLKDLGEGKLETLADASFGPDIIEIPLDFIIPENQNIITHVFGSDGKIFQPENRKKLCSRAILCPKNETCREINHKIVTEMLVGDAHVYKSMDSVDSEDPQVVSNYPTEFLNQQNPSGLSQHCITLKKGAVILLLKNLDTRNGLCNGTRLFILGLTANVIQAEIISGKNIGKVVFIPRITMSPTESDLPFKLNRHQFPVVLAFAITINKSQGQTFENVGIHLEDPVFGHGQLYVAFSRATTRAGVKIWIKESTGPSQTQGRLIKNSSRVFTKNVVFREIFADEE